MGGILIVRHLIQIIFTFVFAFQSLFSLLPYTPPVEKRDMNIVSAETGATFTLTSDYVIVIGEQCVANEQKAAQTLQKYLKQINGVTYEIVTDSAEPAEHEIIVGKTNREGNGYTVNRAELGDEGVYIKTVGEKLVISGAEKRGTLYSVYEFLKIYLGCRWFTAELTVIPETSEIKVPQSIDYTFVPPLYYRSTYFVNCSSAEFCLANHLNGRDIEFSVGGTLFNFAPPSEYFEEHPEYYALVDGVRRPSQLCMMNEDVLQVVIENIQKCLDENPNAGRVQVYPEAFETEPACRCDECIAFNEAEEAVAGSYIHFLNGIAEHFEESYPNVKFATLAYGDTYIPPKNIKAHDNIAIMYAVVDACYAHRLSGESCKHNVNTLEAIAGWAKVANSIEIFDYIADYGHYVGIYPIFHICQTHTQDYVKNNVVGIFGLGNGYSDAVGGFDNLMGYLLSNIYWNPDADYNALMVEFCKAYFGDAAQNIIQYLDIACFRAENSKNLLRQHIKMSEDMHDGGIATLTLGDRQYINALWEEAKACDLTEAQRRNVLHAEICWRYWKASNHVDEFSLRDIDAKKEAAQQLLDDMKAMGINRVCEGEPGRAFSENPNLIRAPFYWQERWDEDNKLLKLL